MKILFLCVANSARSQMAEGLARHLLAPEHSVLSAGSRPTRPNPFAVRAMAAIGIDIAHHQSTAIDAVDLDSVDLIITLCQDEICPVVPAQAEHLHWPFADPAEAEGGDEAVLERFTSIRDQIGEKLRSFFEERGLANRL